MTRVKETKPGSGEIPDYKSHPSRINISLRNAYDNLRVRVADKSKLIQSLRGTTRDLEVSRQKWKSRCNEAENKLNKKEFELAKAKDLIEQLELQLKKK